MTGLLIQQLLYPLYGGLPIRMYLVAQSVQRVYRGLWCALGLQVFREDGDVVVEPLQIFLLDSANALKDFACVQLGLNICRWLAGPWRSIDKLQGGRSDALALATAPR